MNICTGCSRPIFDRIVIKLNDRGQQIIYDQHKQLNSCNSVSNGTQELDDGVWHEECVKCCICSIPLNERCFSRQKKLYCRKDFFRLFGPKCAECDDGISPNDLIRKIRGKTFHVKCLVCFMCRKPISTGEELHFFDNQFLCRYDYLQMCSLNPRISPNTTLNELTGGTLTDLKKNHNGYLQINEINTKPELLDNSNITSNNINNNCLPSSIVSILVKNEQLHPDDELINKNKNNSTTTADNNNLFFSCSLASSRSIYNNTSHQPVISNGSTLTSPSSLYPPSLLQQCNNSQSNLDLTLDSVSGIVGNNSGPAAGLHHSHSADDSGGGSSVVSSIKKERLMNISDSMYDEIKHNFDANSSEEEEEDEDEDDDCTKECGMDMLESNSAEGAAEEQSGSEDLDDSNSGGLHNSQQGGNSGGGKRRGPRTTIKAKQLETLKSAFSATPKPTRHIREQLAQETGLNMRVIQVWFQNRRSKERRMKQLSAMGVRRGYFRNPRRMRALRGGGIMPEDILSDGVDIFGFFAGDAPPPEFYGGPANGFHPVPYPIGSNDFFNPGVLHPGLSHFLTGVPNEHANGILHGGLDAAFFRGQPAPDYPVSSESLTASDAATLQHMRHMDNLNNSFGAAAAASAAIARSRNGAIGNSNFSFVGNPIDSSLMMPASHMPPVSIDIW